MAAPLFCAAGLLMTVATAEAAWDADCANPTATFNAGNMPPSLNLTSVDRILFSDGTFAGSVNSNGGTICVDTAAAFNPTSINGASRLFVRGSVLAPALAAGDGALLDNEGIVVFQGQPNTNGTATVINRATGTIVVQAGLALGPLVTVTNDGVIDVQGSVNLNGSTVTNNAQLTVSGTFNLSGIVTNTGAWTVGGLLTVNGNGTLVNECSLTANGGLINNNTVSNQGLIDLATSQLLNNGSATFTQGPGANTVGGDFTNNGSVTSSGHYLFSGTTLTQGTMAGTSPSEPIVFLDTTPTGTQVLDTENGTITNVVRGPVTPVAPESCDAAATTTTTSSTSSTSTTSTTSTTIPTTTTTTTTASSSTTSPSSAATSTIAAPTTATTGTSGIGGTLPATGSSGAEPLFVIAAVLTLVGLILRVLTRSSSPLNDR